MACAFDQIDFPVPVIKTLLHHRRTFFDTDTVPYPPAPILAPEALPALFAALPQVLVERAPSAMVGIDMLVDAFMADRLPAVPAHHARDLLRTQIVSQVGLDLGLHHRGELDHAPTREAPILRLSLRLLVAIATLTAVAPYFAADRAGIPPEALGYTCLIISLFTHPLYRVSFFLS